MTDAEALDGFQALAQLRGHPAGARVGARGGVRDDASRATLPADAVVLVNLSGRGDKDVQSVVEALR